MYKTVIGVLIIEVILILFVVELMNSYGGFDYGNLTRSNESYKNITIYRFTADENLCGLKAVVTHSNGTREKIIGLNSQGGWLCNRQTTDWYFMRSTLEHEYCHHYRDDYNLSTGYNEQWYIKLREELICSMTFVDYRNANGVV